MSKRRLSPSELAEARLVFGDGLQYDRVRVSEGGYFPNFIADLGALFQGRKRTWDNAVTLGDTSHFPRRLRTEPHELAADLADMAWLIHELTHQWQYQTAGWRYLWEALRVQLSNVSLSDLVQLFSAIDSPGSAIAVQSIEIDHAKGTPHYTSRFTVVAYERKTGTSDARAKKRGRTAS